VSGNREELPLSEEAIERLHEAENVLRDLASQLRAFALNETLGGYAVRLLGYDPLTASGGLFGLSNSLDTYGGGRDFHRKTIAEALRVDVNMIQATCFARSAAPKRSSPAKLGRCPLRHAEVVRE